MRRMDKRSPLVTDYREPLSRSPLFHGLPEPLLEKMLAAFRLESRGKGSRLSALATCERFYVILEGRLEVSRSHPESGRQIVLFLLGPGDGFDLITLLDGEPHETESLALDDLRLLSAPLERVRGWLSEYPEFNRRFLPYLGERLRGLESLASDLALHDTATRMARLILRHTDPQAHGDSHPVRLIADLNHETLARMVGSVRQVVNRHLQGFRRRGLVEGEKGRWVVTDLEALKAQAGEVLRRIEHHERRPRT